MPCSLCGVLMERAVRISLLLLVVGALLALPSSAVVNDESMCATPPNTAIGDYSASGVAFGVYDMAGLKWYNLYKTDTLTADTTTALYIKNFLFKNPADFTSVEMNNVVKQNADVDSYLNPSKYANGGLIEEYDCDSVYRAGVYLYGKVDSVYVSATTKGTEGGALQASYDAPVGYVGVQLFKLYDGYSAFSLLTLMDPGSASDFTLLKSLFANPYREPMLVAGTGTRTGSLGLNAYSGVYYLAVAGGVDSRNGEWDDNQQVQVSIAGDYYSSTSPLSVFQIRSQVGSSRLESSSVLCSLVGEHISELGFSGEAGKIKCCGARGSSDIGQTNLQYVCQLDGDSYSWVSACSMPSGSYTTLQNQYCLGCDTSATGRCTGDLVKYCSGTYTCSGQDEDVCDSLLGCQWQVSYSVMCPGVRIAGPGGDAPEVPAGVSFSGPPLESALLGETPGVPDGCWLVPEPDSASCNAVKLPATAQSCEYFIGDWCTAVDGCSLRDSTGTLLSSYSSCSSYRFTPDECNSRLGCSWECRGDEGDPCGVNSDCKNDLQCDPDFKGVKRCHATDDRCVVGPYSKAELSSGTWSAGAEVTGGSGVCADGVYKKCGVGTTAYSTTYCDYTQANCDGSIIPQYCSGNFYCSTYITQSACDGHSSYNCAWEPAHCQGTYEDPNCGTTQQSAGIEGPGGVPLSGDVSVASLDGAGKLPPVVDTCTLPCSVFTTEAVCTSDAHPTCSWAPDKCSGSISCGSIYTAASCPSSGSCSLYPTATSCSDLSYSDCIDATGCSRTCDAPSFGSAIDPQTSSSACSCAGGSYRSCLPDADGDGFPEAGGAPINRCVFGFSAANPGVSIDGDYYYCASPSEYDCDGTDGSINPGAEEIRCNRVDDDCDSSTPDSCGDGYACDASGACVAEANCYRDADGDGYGNKSVSVVNAGGCAAGYVSNSLDCDDSAQICVMDPSSGWYASCQSAPPAGQASCFNALKAVCDAATTAECGVSGAATSCMLAGVGGGASIHPEPPAAPELCDGIDNDCNKLTRDGLDECASTEWCDNSTNTCKPYLDCYRDADGDGYGSSSAVPLRVKTASCPFGYVDNNADCDDSISYCTIDPSSSRYASCLNVPGPFQSSCFNYYMDMCAAADLSVCGVSGEPADCRLVNPDAIGSSVHPGAAELLDCLDNDCDGTVDEGFAACVGVLGDCAGSLDCAGVFSGTGVCPAGCVDSGICADNSLCDAAHPCGGGSDCSLYDCSGSVNCANFGTMSCSSYSSYGCSASSCSSSTYKSTTNPLQGGPACDDISGCTWDCGGGSVVQKEICSNGVDDDGVNGIDCQDSACNGGGALSLTDSQLSQYNCLGTDQTGDKTGLSYYCGVGFDTQQDKYVSDVGLCCRTGEEPRKVEDFGTWYWRCEPTDPCYPAPPFECDFDYSTQFTDWLGDSGCLDSSSNSACCNVIKFGTSDYYSDNNNVKVY